MPNVLFRGLCGLLQSTFWLVPAAVIQMHGFSDRSVVLASTLTGVAWQLVHRRDLADRLVVLAMFWVVLGFGTAVLDGAEVRLDAGPTTATVGIVMGLVATEQVLRFLEGRRILRQQAQRAHHESAVPTGP